MRCKYTHFYISSNDIHINHHIKPQRQIIIYYYEKSY